MSDSLPPASGLLGTASSAAVDIFSTNGFTITAEEAEILRHCHFQTELVVSLIKTSLSSSFRFASF